MSAVAVRAMTIAAWREVLRIAGAHPELPLPSLRASDGSVHYALHGYRTEAPALLAAIEAALPCEMTFRGVTADDRYDLTGDIGGVPVVISAYAPDVADQRVTGEHTQVVKEVEWVRKHVAAGSAS